MIDYARLVKTREEWTTSYLAASGEHHMPDEPEVLLARIRRAALVPDGARILEVGVGTGWLLQQLADRGFKCEGIEYNDVSQAWAVEATGLPIHLGSIETIDLPEDTFDVVLAESVFEHVADHRAGFQNVYRTLKPGGAFHFVSTHKLSRHSTEFQFPGYGWLPKKLRWELRMHTERSGLRTEPAFFDWHQFTYPGLRRDFRRVGFSKIFDRFDLLDPADKTGAKRALIQAYKTVPMLKQAMLLTPLVTEFCCVK